MIHLLHVVGARPNFVKLAPVMRALQARPSVRQTLVHSGQHFDHNMSKIFFDQLGIPAPDINLEVGSATNTVQTAQVMMKLEPVLLEAKPDMVVVYGDVNTTAAAALVCAKLGIDFSHVEAGLRSFDRTMPEEINRIVTDKLATLLFTPSLDGNDNLAREGTRGENVHLVGNVMIDTLIRLLPQARLPRLAEMPGRYALVTLHRPSNVDAEPRLREIINSLIELSVIFPVVFPVHPRTQQRIASLGLGSALGGRIRLLEPLGYLEFLALQRSAAVVVTDSGGVQEETTFLGVPCLTLRENTERPITATLGTNKLIGHDMSALRREFEVIANGNAKKGTLPPLWDGRAGERIAAILA